MNLEHAIEDIVKRTVIELIGNNDLTDTDFISIKEAAAIANCDESIIQSLVKERRINNFPAAALGKKTIRIDKRRLYQWLGSGGLNGTD